MKESGSELLTTEQRQVLGPTSISLTGSISSLSPLMVSVSISSRRQAWGEGQVKTNLNRPFQCFLKVVLPGWSRQRRPSSAAHPPERTAGRHQHGSSASFDDKSPLWCGFPPTAAGCPTQCLISPDRKTRGQRRTKSLDQDWDLLCVEYLSI